jgi:HEAT repeat
LSDLIKQPVFTKFLQDPLLSLCSDPVPNVRFNLLKCLRTLSEEIKEKPVSESLQKAASKLAEDADIETRNLAREIKGAG